MHGLAIPFPAACRCFAATLGAAAAISSPLAAQGPDTPVSPTLKVIDNPSRKTAPIAFRLADRPTLDLGGLKENLEDEFTPNAGNLVSVALSNGHVVVTDQTRLRVFDATGKQLKVVGRKGGGPGEFGEINGICRTRGDTILVSDNTNRRITVIDGAGRVVRNLPLRGYLVWGGACFDDGTFVLAPETLQTKGDRRIHVVRYHLDGRLIDTIGGFVSPARNPYIGSSTSIAVHGRRLYVGDPRKSEVRVFDQRGVLIQVIRTADPVERLSAVERSSLTSEGFGRRTNSPADLARAAESLRRAPRPTEWPSFESIQIDPHGRLWIREYRKHHRGSHVFTAFSHDGRLLGRFVMPEQKAIGDPMVLRFVSGGVLIQRHDEDGARHLTTYPLVPVKVQ